MVGSRTLTDCPKAIPRLSWMCFPCLFEDKPSWFLQNLRRNFQGMVWQKTSRSKECYVTPDLWCPPSCTQDHTSQGFCSCLFPGQLLRSLAALQVLVSAAPLQMAHTRNPSGKVFLPLVPSLSSGCSSLDLRLVSLHSRWKNVQTPDVIATSQSMS